MDVKIPDNSISLSSIPPQHTEPVQEPQANPNITSPIPTTENYTIDVKFVDSTTDNLIHHVQKNLLWTRDTISIVVQITKGPNPAKQHSIEDYDDAKNPFAKDEDEDGQQISPAPQDYDETKNPFSDFSDEESEVVSPTTNLGDESMETQQNLN